MVVPEEEAQGAHHADTVLLLPAGLLPLADALPLRVALVLLLPHHTVPALLLPVLVDLLPLQTRAPRDPVHLAPRTTKVLDITKYLHTISFLIIQAYIWIAGLDKLERPID